MSVIWSGVTEEGAVVPVQVTDEGKVVAVGDGPQGDYLPITGGNLTGDLTLGTDKITLNATDGSAEFAGRVDGATFIVGDNPNSGSGTGSRLDDGKVLASRPSGAVFAGYTTGNNTSTAVINANGSAGFASSVRVGDSVETSTSEFSTIESTGEIALQNNYGDRSKKVFTVFNGLYSDPNSRKIQMLADGSANFKGFVDIGSPSHTGIGEQATNNSGVLPSLWLQNYASPGPLMQGYSSGGKTVEISNSGSASFDGDVIIGSRGVKWLIRESNGVAMLIEQSREAAPMIPEKVRDIPGELDLIEMALNEVMEKLRMTPPAGWPVWDGSDNP